MHGCFSTRRLSARTIEWMNSSGLPTERRRVPVLLTKPEVSLECQLPGVQSATANRRCGSEDALGPDEAAACQSREGGGQHRSQSQLDRSLAQMAGLGGPQAAQAVYRLLGKLNTVPSRTPAEGQRCVMVLRLV